MTQISEASRPTTIEGVKQLTKALGLADAMRQKSLFRSLPTDVFIATYRKAGTTWLQQIVHSLRTRGDMSFDNIAQVVPWLETAGFLGIDLDAAQPAHPRTFKSHLTWENIPKPGKYIVCIREPKDVLVSGYHFMEGFFFEPGTITLETWAREQFIPQRKAGGYWGHLCSWWQHRHEPDVLILCYEDMKADLSATVQFVAQFIGIELDDELLDIVLTQSSFDYMSAHKAKFREKLIQQQLEKVAGLPTNHNANLINRGQIGSHHLYLPKHIAAEMDQVWHEEITATLGFATYEALRQTLAHERTRQMIRSSNRNA